MVRGPRKHMKRVAAPTHWMLDKLGGCYAPRPSSGPHKLRECLPLALFLRNRLKYALSYTEVKKILAQRLVKVDGRVRTDHTYPAGFMDVIEMEKSGENFRLIYDVKGRYKVHRISKEEASYKLCIVKKVSVGPKGIPYLTTSDGRTIRYPDPLIKAQDCVKVDIASGKITDTSNSSPATFAWSREVVTWVASASSCTVKSIPDPSTSSTSRMPQDTPSPPDCITSSRSAREPSLGCLCPKARESA